MKRIRNLLLISVLCASAAIAGNDESPLRALESGGLSAAQDAGDRKVYIVQLQAPAAAEEFAKATKPSGKVQATGLAAPKFDKNHALVRDYTSQLARQQEEVIRKAGAGTEAIYNYVYGINGFAARMTPGQANKLKHMPEVLAVWEDEIRPLATNFSPDFLGLFDGEKGLRGPEGLDGEDVIIGVIDSGIYPEHPALQDTQEADRPKVCRSTWGESSLLGRWLCRRFRKMEDRVVYEPVENFNGICQAGTEFTADSCNNKIIGARWYINGAENSGPIDEGELRSPRDVDGHGTHTATTAAGNRVTASIYGTQIDTVEGIAPRARIAVYKACWVRPGDQRASCNTSDLASAIDEAVADGVDIINYSVGSTLLRITAPDDVALMNATKAGVLAVVAAGNEGPNLGTLGSPAGGPWVITAAASSRDGETSREAMQIEAPSSIAGKYAVREANFTPPLADNDPIEGELVLVDDNDNAGGAGTTSDACEAPVNDTALSGNIALIQRGGCDFDVKVQNVEDAGAVAAVVYNINGGPIVMSSGGGSPDIPALMVGQADGNLFIEQVDAGETITAVLDKGFFLTEEETGNKMGVFSSRGPGPVPDVLKPDVTAPGINILAGITPEAVNRTPDQSFGYLTGTSMAAPHVAGVAALLKQAHPSWGPAAIKSAIMTTARQDVTQSNSETLANPFDFGTGHIVPNDALNPGLVYEISNDDYDAYACGLSFPNVAPERCNDLIAAGFSTQPQALNQPSVAMARVTAEQTVTRRVTNVSDEAAVFTASIAPPVEMQVFIDPPSLSLAPGETASYDITARYVSGPLDLWRFGSLTWNSDDHSVHSTLAIKPVTLSAPFEITSFGGTGSIDFNATFGYSGTYTPRVHGLRLPLVIDGFVDNDPTKTFTFRETNGVTAHRITVPPNQLYMRFAMFDEFTDGNDDLDMYIYYCGFATVFNLNTCTEIGLSGEPTSEERFDTFRPPAGEYFVLVHGFETDQQAGGAGANYQLFGWAFGEIDNQGNMGVSGPSIVAAGASEVITVDWSNLVSNTIYFGGISHNTPSGLGGLTLVTIRN